MNVANSPLTLLIAAEDAGQSHALADMLKSLRPGLHVVDLETAATEPPSLAMIVEPLGPNFGAISAKVRAAHPDLRLVLIASRFDDAAIAKAAELRVSAIVPAPCEAATLGRALKAHERQVAFSGRVSGIETGELLRLHAAASSNGVIHLTGDGRSGAIHLEEGQPVHAQAGDLRGSEAVRELLGWADAHATWISGRSASARTILGRVEGLLDREPVGFPPASEDFGDALRDVIEKLERLARTPDILAAYLLRNTEVVVGTAEDELDPALVGRALSRLATVFQDVEEQQNQGATEIQATVGEHRLVVDRLGPAPLGFQIGVVVRQATPVCKSLRRLLRQVDRSFRRALQNQSKSTPAVSTTVNRVAV